MTLPAGYSVRWYPHRHQQPWTLRKQRPVPSGDDRHKGWARLWEVMQFCETEDDAEMWAEDQVRHKQAGLPQHQLGSTYRDLRA